MGTTLRYCVICEVATSRDADGQCRPCHWWERLHHNIEVLIRADVLTRSNEIDEYIPPVLECEAVG